MELLVGTQGLSYLNYSVVFSKAVVGKDKSLVKSNLKAFEQCGNSL